METLTWPAQCPTAAEESEEPPAWSVVSFAQKRHQVLTLQPHQLIIANETIITIKALNAYYKHH